MTSTAARAVVIAISALVAGGCGSETATTTSTTTSTATATTTASAITQPTRAPQARPQHPHIDKPNRAGAYRLAALPIVVRDADGWAFGLYFRLNRSLTDGQLVETIDDIHTDNLAGSGYDSFAPGHCYFAYATGVPSYFEIASARAGQVIPVTIAFHYPNNGGVLRGYARLRNVQPGEDAEFENPHRYHELGCRS